MCWIEPPWELLRDGRKEREPRRATQHLCYKTAPCRCRMGRISDGLCPNLITRQAGRPFFLAFLGFSDSGRDIGDWALPISPGLKYESRVQHCAKKFLLKLVREALSGLIGPCIGCYKLVGRRKEGNSNMHDFLHGLVHTFDP